MKINNKKTILAILIFCLVTGLVLLDIHYFYIKAIFSLLFLTIIPGLLIMMTFGIKKNDPWEYLVYVVGLSIAFLMFGGLAINTIIPWLHVSYKPLSLVPLLTSTYVALFIFGIFAYIRNKKVSWKINLPRLNRLNKVFFIMPLVFPILSVLGAISLNNGGHDYFTSIMLGGIATYVFLSVFLWEKLNNHVFPWAIFFTSLSLLLMYSLRSWHISGWDINEEFQMFQITKSAGYWSPDLIKHAYNSCLSLTILPTIISRFTNIPDEYIYKMIYPLFFSFVPLTMYCIFKRFSMPVLSFLAVFFFIAQPWFIQPMAALARQEIAFLFFALSLLILFSKSIGSINKYLFFLIFSFAVVVSHYSTSYLAVTIYLISYILIFVYKQAGSVKLLKRLPIFTSHRSLKKQIVHYHLKIFPILLIILFTLIWNTQVTNTAHNLSYVAEQTLTNMGNAFSDDFKSWDVNASLAIFAQPNTNTVENINEYQKSQIQLRKINSENYYTGDEELIPLQNVEVKPRIVTPYNSSLFTILAIFKLLTKVMLVAGPLVILFSYFKTAKIDREFILLSLVGSGAILFMFALPVISQFYNLTRVYMQMLIILSLPTIYAGYILLKFVRNNLGIKILGTFFVLYFLYVSGFFSQILGGYAFSHLNNFGEDYDKFYTHQEEVNSARWLSKVRDNKSLIFADEVSALRLYSFGNINTVEDVILPKLITKDSYVYLRYANVMRDRTDAHYKDKILIYSFPNEFLLKNKNLVYNNKSSMIYK